MERELREQLDRAAIPAEVLRRARRRIKDGQGTHDLALLSKQEWPSVMMRKPLSEPTSAALKALCRFAG